MLWIYTSCRIAAQHVCLLPAAAPLHNLLPYHAPTYQRPTLPLPRRLFHYLFAATYRKLSHPVSSPPSCTPQDIFCRCGAAFCFNCKEEAHRPVDCETVRLWMVGKAC